MRIKRYLSHMCSAIGFIIRSLYKTALKKGRYTIVHAIGFGLEQGDGIPITPRILELPPIPLEASRGINTKTCRLDDVIPTDDLCSGPFINFIHYYKHIMYFKCILSNCNTLFVKHTHTKSCCGHDGILVNAILLFSPAWFQLCYSVVLFTIIWIIIWI